MHHYRLMHGEWPANLEQLVPAFLPKLPCDPFTNGQLKVEKHPEMPDVLSVYSARKTGEEESSDALLHKGFPVRPEVK